MTWCGAILGQYLLSRVTFGFSLAHLRSTRVATFSNWDWLVLCILFQPQSIYFLVPMAWFAAALLAQTGYWFLRWSLNIEHWIYLALVNFWTAPKFEPIVDVDLSFCGCLQAFLLCVHALEFKLLVVWFLHCGYQGHQSVDVELWLKMRHPPSNYSIHTCISQPSSSAASSRPVRPQASSASHASPWPRGPAHSPIPATASSSTH